MKIQILFIYLILLSFSLSLSAEVIKLEDYILVPPDSLELKITSNPEGNCAGTLMELTAVMVSQNNSTTDNPLTYEWSGPGVYNESGSKIKVSGGGEYSVTATNSHGEHFVNSIKFESDIASYIIFQDKFICGDMPAEVDVRSVVRSIGESNNINVEWPEGTISAYKYQWETDQYEMKPNDMGYILEAGNHNITITNTKSQCKYIHNISAEKIEAPVFGLVADQEELCEGEQGKITFTPPKKSDIAFEQKWKKRGKTQLKDNVLTINGPGWYSMTLTDPDSECSFKEEIEIESSKCKIKFTSNISVECGKKSIHLTALSDDIISSDGYRWTKYDAVEKKHIPLIGNTSVIEVPGPGTYEVNATTVDGCKCIHNNKVWGVANDESGLASYFRQQGFYETEISDIKMQHEGAERFNLCKADISNDTRYFDDSNIASFKMLDENDMDLKTLIESNLKYFRNSYDLDASVYITSNKGICNCENYLEKVKTKLESKKYAFWFHIYENELGKSKLYVLANNKNLNGKNIQIPGTSRRAKYRIREINEIISALKYKDAGGNFSSNNEKAIFTIMNLLLNVH